MIIAVDFDGTLSMAKYPECGMPNTRLINELNDYKRNGARLILWTCRHGKPLVDAIEFCKLNGLTFDAINENLPDLIAEYGDTRKVFADYYIDDKNKPLPEIKPKHGMYEQAKIEVL